MMAAEPILLQLASSPGDSSAVQATKLQKLWLLQQVYQAFESRAAAPKQLAAQQQQHVPTAACKRQPVQFDTAAELQAGVPGPVLCSCGAVGPPQHSPSCQHNQQQDGLTRQQCQQQQQRKQHTHPCHDNLVRHQHPAPLRQLLGTDSTEDQVPADMQQQSDQGRPAHQHDMQDAGHMLPPPTMQPPASNRDILARLLLPGQGRSGPAAAAGGGAASAGAAASIPTGQGRQRRLQHNRRSVLGGQDSAAHAALAAAAGHPQQPGWQEGVEDSPGPLQQQQMLHMRAQYLYDAQSQAQGAAAGTEALQRPVLAAQQQLFSPRTATHAPAAGSGGSNSAGLAHSSWQQCMSPSHELQPSAPQQQQQQAAEPEAEVPEEIEVTPAQPRSGQLTATSRAATAHQQQQWGSGLVTAVAAVTAGNAAAAAGGGGGGGGRGSSFPLLPGTAATPGVVPDLDAAAAAAASASVIQTPATAHTELIAAAGSRRAAAAAGLAAALFHTPGPTAAGQAHLRGVSMEPANAAAHAEQHAAGRLECIAESSYLGETPPSAAQHVSAASGVTPLAPTAQHSAEAAAAGAGDIAGPSATDETQPPSQPLQGEGALLAGAQSDVLSQVAATPASNTASAGALPSVPCSRSAGKRKSADAAALMLPPPPVTSLAARSPAAAQLLPAGSPAEQHAWQRNKKPRPSPLNPAGRQAQAAAIAAAAAASGSTAKPKAPEHAAAAFSSGSRSFVLDQHQQRLHELHVGLPVAHVMCCGGYAAALLQDPLGSSACRLMLLHSGRARQQQLGRVTVTAEYASVFVGPAQQPGPTPARRTSPAHQQQGQLHSDLLRAGLLLLPQCWAAPDSQQQGWPLLAVASELQVHLGPTAAAAAEVTPDAAQQPKLAALHSAGGSKRKLPRSAAGALQGGATSPHAGLASNHAVSIYQLKQSPNSLTPGGKGQSSSTGAELVLSLPVAHAVRCLATCEQPQLLAAAGSSGFACVWPLQQQPVPCPGAASTAANAAGSDQCAVVDASTAVMLPAACYKGVLFPDVSELCFMTTGASSLNLPPDQRVLLVGASSLGSVAVWDVSRRQQVIAVHCPDLRLSGLMAPAPHIERAALAAAMQAAQAAAGSDAAAAAAAGCTQQAAGGGVYGPVVCLATVRSIDSSARAGQQQQQGMKQLKAVVFHSSGEMQVGAALLAAGRQGGIEAAALAGSTAAAVTGAGAVQVWDVLSGQRLMALKPRAGAVSRVGAGTVVVLSLPTLLGPGAVGASQGYDAVREPSAGEVMCCTVVLTGSASGVLTAAFV